MLLVYDNQLGWSDFHFQRFSKMDTVLLIGYIFRSLIPTNRQILRRARAPIFIFENPRRPSKIKIFFFVNIFLLPLRTIIKKKIREKFVISILFQAPKLGKTVCDLVNEKNKFCSSFSAFQLLNKLRRKFCFRYNFKNVN